MIRIGHNSAQRHGAGPRVHGKIGKVQRTSVGINCVIGQQYIHTCRLLTAPFGQWPGALQLLQLRHRLAEIHIGRIDLFNGRELRSLTLTHQRPFSHQSAAGTPVDRCRNRSVTEIQSRFLHIGLSLFHRGRGGTFVCQCGIQILAGNQAFFP